MKDKAETKNFYVNTLGFPNCNEYPDYLIIWNEAIELQFFLFPDLNVYENYGMCYIRVQGIETLYQDFVDRQIPMPELGKLEAKPWGQKEFSVLDTNHNLLTFGEAI